jgi:hypothetical protein
MRGDTLTIYPDHGRARRAVGLGDGLVVVVSSRVEADKLRGYRPRRVQLALHGWGGDRGALGYLLEWIISPMVVDGAQIEFVQ